MATVSSEKLSHRVSRQCRGVPFGALLGLFVLASSNVTAQSTAKPRIVSVARGQWVGEFTSVTSAQPTVGGILVVDQQERRVYHATTKGTAEAIRPGDGPLELTAPLRIVGLVDGSMLVVGREGSTGVIIDQAGKAARSFNVRSLERLPTRWLRTPLGSDDQGRILFSGPIIGTSNSQNTDSVALFVVDPVRGAVSTAGKLYAPSPVNLRAGGQVAARPAGSIPLERDEVLFSPAGELVVLRHGSAQIDVVDVAGAVKRTLELPAKAHVLTSAAVRRRRDAFDSLRRTLDSTLRGVSPEARAIAMASMNASAAVPRAIAPYASGSFRFLDKSRVFVERSTATADATGPVLDIVDLRSGRVESIMLDAGVRVFGAGDGYVIVGRLTPDDLIQVAAIPVSR